MTGSFLHPAAMLLPALFLLSACAGSVIETAPGEPPSSATFEADRAAILAMAGDYRVTFDFTETVSFDADYEPRERKLSGAHEIVRVIEDRGDFISLQHILVVGEEEKFAIKHWRQDWAYEPAHVLVYVGGNAWERRAVESDEAAGKWSQTVYQVDDAPRYGALGAWTHVGGISQWEPPREWRPLPRRDATTRDDYHAIDAINRHTITPDGWVHEQDNTKLVLDGAPHMLVREIGVNTYIRDETIEAAVADAYWTATEGYWAGVRAIWSQLETRGERFGLTVQGEPEPVYIPLLDLADKVKDGEMSETAAIEAARGVIARFTTEDIGTLAARLAAD